MQADCRAQNMPVYAGAHQIDFYLIKTESGGLLDKSEVVRRTGQRKKHFLKLKRIFFWLKVQI
jgi:hypothetical protein